MIEVHNLSKIFEDKKRGRVVAADNVTFTAGPGEIFGLLGLNGAGKTTVLRIIATILKPSSGNVRVWGVDVVREPEKAKANLGFLTGETGLYGRLTAREMIGYFGRLYGMPARLLKNRTDELMQLFNMTEFADVRCDKLSFGTKQKVSIARTIIHDPRAIVLDEPTVGLDVITSRAVVDFIRNEKRRGKAIVFSTHVMHEAEKLCDKIGIIHRGRIIAVGTPNELKAASGRDDMDEAFVALIEGDGHAA